MSIDYTLYLVTDRQLVGDKDFYASIEEALLGGVTLLQLREKSISTLEFHKIAQDIKRIANKYKVPFIINDRLDIALSVDADGLHIGQDDMPVSIARKLLGPDKVIGVSASNIKEALLAEQLGADYLGIGAIFATGTKRDAHHTDLAELSRIRAATHIPIVAIGGINESNVPDIMKTGVNGVAVVSAILDKDNVNVAAQNLRRLIDSQKRK